MIGPDEDELRMLRHLCEAAEHVLNGQDDPHFVGRGPMTRWRWDAPLGGVDLYGCDDMRLSRMAGRTVLSAYARSDVNNPRLRISENAELGRDIGLKPTKALAIDAILRLATYFDPATSATMAGEDEDSCLGFMQICAALLDKAGFDWSQRVMALPPGEDGRFWIVSGDGVGNRMQVWDSQPKEWSGEFHIPPSGRGRFSPAAASSILDRCRGTVTMTAYGMQPRTGNQKVTCMVNPHKAVQVVRMDSMETMRILSRLPSDASLTEPKRRRRTR